MECAYIPNFVPLSDDRVLCFYRAGSAFLSVDGVLAMLRSVDGGKNWQTEGLVWEPINDDIPYSYGSPHGTRMKDGTVILLAERWDCTNPRQLMYNPDTGGMRTVECVLFRSSDDGHTWSEPEVLALPVNGLVNPPSQIVELNDGRWFMACELWKSWDDEDALHIKGFAIYSDDQGRTWSGRRDFPYAADAKKMYSHSRYTRMLDGRVAALHWTQRVGTDTDVDIHITISDEATNEWSEPQPTGMMGQTSWMADMGDGVLMAAYTLREGMEPSIRAILSRDEGVTWDFEHEVVIWDAVGQEYLGTERRPSYPASHDNLAFGKPNAARMPNGEIICSWWCTQACVTHARFARLALE